ncbi:MAG: hypothetical protein M0Q49_01885 [Porticoccaceae bacterium]|nr:hypothetical protein [Porticoccaceae bacterium]
MSATPFGINIRIYAAEPAAALARLRGAVAANTAIHKIMAEAVAKDLRPWFVARNARKSRHTTSNYWAKAAEAIHTTATVQSGTVTIRHPGIRWHLEGGTIHAKPGKAMAIPLRDALYGVWPREHFPSREDAFVFRHRGKAFLAARPERGVGQGRGKRQLRILYLLLRSVSKGPDASVLPPKAQMRATANNAVRSFINRAIAGHTK